MLNAVDLFLIGEKAILRAISTLDAKNLEASFVIRRECS